MNENIKAALVEATVKMFEDKVAVALAKFAEIRNKWDTTEDFEADMADIASQIKWDGQRYGGFRPECTMNEGVFAGGLEEYVMSNVFATLGMSLGDHAEKQTQEFRWAVYPAIMAEAIKQNADLKLFMESVIQGALKVQVAVAIRRGRDAQWVEAIKKAWADWRAKLGL